MMKRYVLWGILLVATVLRLYTLSHVPPSPSLDEVSIGYNAFSLLHTGKDEYGYVLPTLLRAYDDYRPALYVYLTIPFIAMFGLTALAMRLPSVILSILTIWVAYNIGKMIGKKYISYEWLGHITAFFLAISPWHIYISRLGHEANLGLALTTMGIYFFFQAVLEGKHRAFIWSAVYMGLSLHGYQSEKIVSPLFIFFGMLLFWKNLMKAKREVIFAFCIGVMIAIPAVLATVSPEGMVRFRGTSAFSSEAPLVVAATNEYIKARNTGDTVGMLAHSKYVVYTQIFIQNYLSHFSPKWLFTGAIREAHKVPGLGLLYLWEAPFLIIGLLALLRSKVSWQTRVLIILTLLIAPIPASVTTQAPHAMRSYTFLPMIQLVEAYGFWDIIRRLTREEKRSVWVVMCVFLTVSGVMFYNGYFVRFPKEQSDSFQYAMAPLVQYAQSQEHMYNRIEISHQGSLYQSYMFFLYYSQFDPRTYLALGGTKSGGYEASHIIGKYSFGFLPTKAEEFKDDTLYFYDARLVPSGARIIDRFANANGEPAIVAAVK